jgi:hypothetical protein
MENVFPAGRGKIFMQHLRKSGEGEKKVIRWSNGVDGAGHDLKPRIMLKAAHSYMKSIF